MKEKPRSYEASDYAGLQGGDWEFYYGYETIFCPKHSVYGPQDSSSCAYDNNGNEECDGQVEWCFVAKQRGEILGWYPQSKLEKLAGGDQMSHYLMAGIALLVIEGKH